MSQNNFTRSNVNEQTLLVSEPNRSGFDLSHRVNTTLKLGRLTPVNIERLLPTDIVQGSLSPKFQLENCGTPTIGKLRLDTHTFQVNMRRIHNGFRQFMEDNSNNSTLPSFDIPTLAMRYMQYVCYYGANNSFPSSIAPFVGTLADLGMVGTETTVKQIADNILKLFTDGLLSILNHSTNEFGWHKDFISLEWQRLSSISVPNDNTSLGYVIYQILFSLFGEGSLLDMIGYPVYSRLSAWGLSMINKDMSLSALSDINYDLQKILTVSDYDGRAEEFKTYVPSFEQYSEMPLRAIYAIYYDYFRDWHVEPRDSVLNPDNFSQSNLLQYSGNPEGHFSNILQLLVLRFRNFSRDFLTTVQTDDIFRHIYQPIIGEDAAGTSTFGALSLDDTTTEGIVSSFTSILENLPLPFTPFLSNSFNSYPSTGVGYSVATMFSDLQTMRRTGMLEKWLARNYFFPDTYVGHLRAHYDVVPEDINYINCQYLGGTEQLVEGNQTIAPVDTPQMDAGTRTVVSGVNANDSFTYRASDHCYIISFVSLMPIVNYDIKNMHLKELRKMDIADPVFAQDSRVAVRLKDMLRGFDDNDNILGYVPRYYQYRVHGDETHGRYLNDYRSFSWFRDWYNMTFVEFASFNDDDKIIRKRGFVLSPYSLRVHLSLDAFNDKLPWDDIAFGSCDIQFFKNTPLPGVVDII